MTRKTSIDAQQIKTFLKIYLCVCTCAPGCPWMPEVVLDPSKLEFFFEMGSYCVVLANLELTI